MAIVQEMCARIGLVTGRGLATNIRMHFPRWVLYLTAILLFFVNTFAIGANLGAMAAATQLILPILAFWILVVFFSIFTVVLEISLPYQRYAKYLKYLGLFLIAYIITPFMIKDFGWVAALKSSVLPSLNFSKDQIILVCAVLGSTITPSLFFWQTSQEVEEKLLNKKRDISLQQKVGDGAIKRMRIDVWSGMFFSNLIMFFVIAVCASVLFPHGIFSIETASDAAGALKPLAGDNAYLIFAIGIIGLGLLGIPILAGSASYAISETFGWKEGFSHRFKEASSFYGVIIVSILIGLAINFLGINPIKALIYAAILNGLMAPAVLVLIVILASNRKVMGERKNHPATSIFGWVVTALMAIVGVATIIAIF
jgi:Mn2+/Fe2+ NRAMP family transporter